MTTWLISPFLAWKRFKAEVNYLRQNYEAEIQTRVLGD